MITIETIESKLEKTMKKLQKTKELMLNLTLDEACMRDLRTVYDDLMSVKERLTWANHNDLVYLNDKVDDLTLTVNIKYSWWKNPINKKG